MYLASPKIKKIIASLLVVATFGSYLGPFSDDFPKASAASIDQPSQDALVVLLVEGYLLDAPETSEIREKIIRYSQDIQAELPQTKTAIIKVSENETAQQISAGLKQIYFNAAAFAQLEGVVLIGDVPIPEVKTAEGTFISMYPYVDFIKPAFSFNNESQIFEKNNQSIHPQPEIWHGIIKPPLDTRSKESQEMLNQYFDRNHLYHQGDGQVSTFDQKVLVADIIGENKTINSFDWNRYRRYMDIAEQREYFQYDTELLNTIFSEFQAESQQVFEGLDNPFSNINFDFNELSSGAIKNMVDKYASPAHTIADSYIQNWNTLVGGSGRWSSSELDTLPSLIAQRDFFAQGLIREINESFENALESVVSSGWALPQSIIKNIRPTAEDIQQQALSMIGGDQVDMPIDKIRNIEFINQLDQQETIEYVNFFDISNANNPNSIQDDIESELLFRSRDLRRAIRDNIIETYKFYISASLGNVGENFELLVDQNFENQFAQLLSQTELLLQQQYPNRRGLDVIESYIEDFLSGQQDFEQELQDIVAQNFPKFFNNSSVLQNFSNRSVATEFQSALTFSQFYEQRSSSVVMTITQGGNTQTSARNFTTPSLIDENFYLRRAEEINLGLIIDTLLWLEMPLEKKHEVMLETAMSESEKKLPVSARSGYELFYLRAPGTHLAADVTVHPSKKGNFTDPELQRIQTARNAFNDTTKETFVGDGETECGNIYQGVEIWEWFPAIVCWMNSLEATFTNTSCLAGDSVLPEIEKALSDETENFSKNRIRIVNSSFQNFPNGIQTIVGGEEQVIVNVEVVNEQGERITDFSRGLELQIGDKNIVASSADIIIAKNGIGQFTVNSENLSGSTQLQIVDPQGAITNSAKVSFTSWPLQPSAVRVDGGNVGVVGQLAFIDIFAIDRLGNTVKGEPIVFNVTTSQGSISLLDNETQQTVSELSKNQNDGFLRVPVIFNEAGSARMSITINDEISRDVDVRVVDTANLDLSIALIDIENDIHTLTAKIQDEAGNDLEIHNAEIVFAAQPSSVVAFIDTPITVMNKGLAQARVQVLDPGTEISFSVTSVGIGADNLLLRPSGGTKPVALAFEKNTLTHNAQDLVNFSIFVVDEKGRRVDANIPIRLRLTEATQQAGVIVTNNFTTQNGVLQASFQPGNNSSIANIVAEAEGLVSDALTIEMSLELESDEILGIGPQSLYSVLLGFPAGQVNEFNYFAGSQLFSGKSQAVTAFSAPASSVNKRLVEFLDNGTVLSANENIQITPFFNTEKLSFRASQNGVDVVERVLLLPDEIILGEFDSNSDQEGVFYEHIANETAVNVIDAGDRMILRTEGITFAEVHKSGGIFIFDNRFLFRLDELNSEDSLKFNVFFGGVVIGRLHYIVDMPFRATDFSLLSTNVRLDAFEKQVGQKNERAYALISTEGIDANIEIPTYEGEGWVDQKKQAMLFAGQGFIGQVSKQDLSINEMLFGDPTISLGKEDAEVSFNQSLGQPILFHEEGQTIKEILEFDYNGDQNQDLLLRYETGEIDVLPRIVRPPFFGNKKELLRLPSLEADITPIDIDSDGDDDLIASLDTGETLLFGNEAGEFIERSFNFGKEASVKQIERADLDNDGVNDLVAVFGDGDVQAFYLTARGRIEQIGGLGNFGVRIKNENLASELLFAEPRFDQENSTILQHGISKAQQNSQNPITEFPNTVDGINLSPQQIISNFAQNNPDKSIEIEPSSGDISSNFVGLDGAGNFVSVGKNGRSLDQGSIKKGSIIQYQVRISSRDTLNDFIVADPIHPHMSLVEGSLVCRGCPESVQLVQNGNHIFAGRLQLQAGQSFAIEYQTRIDFVPEVSISFADLRNDQGVLDEFKDIIVRPKDQQAGQAVYLFSNGPRSYQAKLQIAQPANIDIPDLDFTDNNNNNIPDKDENNVFDRLKGGFIDDNDNDGIPNIFDDVDASQTFPISQIDWSNLTANVDFDASFGINGLGEVDATVPPEVANMIGAVGNVADAVSATLENLKCGGGCIGLPINYAFLVPGDIGAPFASPRGGVSVPVGKAPGFPIIGSPGIPPSPVCVGTTCYTSPSTYRFYLSPTLTGGIAMASCFGLTAPVPTAPFGGQCFVFAPKIPTFSEVCDRITAELNNFIDLVKGEVAGGTSDTIFTVGKGPLQVSGGGQNRSQTAGGYEMTLFDLGTYDIPAQESRNRRIPAIDDFGGIFVDWWDRQSSEIVNKLLTLPSLHFKLPDFTDFWQNTQDFAQGPAEYIRAQQDQVKAQNDEVQKQKEALAKQQAQQENKARQKVEALAKELSSLKSVGTNQQAQQELRLKQAEFQEAQRQLESVIASNEPDLLDQTFGFFEETVPDTIFNSGIIENSEGEEVSLNDISTNVKGLYEWLKNMPLITIEERKTVFKYPYMSQRAIEYVLDDLESWLIDAEEEIARATAEWTNIIESCSAEDKAVLQREIAAAGGVENLDAKIVADFKLEQCQQAHIASKVLVDASALIADVKKNIEILKSYKEFPKKILQYKYALVEYLDQVLCYIEKFIDLMGGYFAEIKVALEQWIELFITLEEIWKTIAIIPNTFNALLEECSQCRNERFTLSLSALLGLLIPEIPVIQFPKWPDLVVDLTDIDAQVTIPIPEIEFVAEEIILPELPRIALPEVPSINVTLPGIPLLPQLPDLPQLPKLPDLPLPDLPPLPPPPKLPEIFADISGFVDVIEKVLRLICLINEFMLPIPEESLKPTIERYTARGANMLDIDFLFTFNLPSLSNSFIEKIIVSMRTYAEVEVGSYYSVLEDLAVEWNQTVTDLTDEMNEKTTNIFNGLEDHLDQSNLFPRNIDVDLVNDQIRSGRSDLGQIDESFDGPGNAINEANRSLNNIRNEVQDGVTDIEDGLQDGVDLQSKVLFDNFIKIREFVQNKSSNMLSVAEVRHRLGIEKPEIYWPKDSTGAEFIALYEKVLAYKNHHGNHNNVADAKDLADRFIAYSPNRLASVEVSQNSTQRYALNMHGKKAEYTQQQVKDRLLAQANTLPSSIRFDNQIRAIAENTRLNTLEPQPIVPGVGRFDSIEAQYRPCGMMIMNNQSGLVRPFVAYEKEICDQETQQLFMDVNGDGDEDAIISFGDQIYIKMNQEIEDTKDTFTYYSDIPAIRSLSDFSKEGSLFTDFFEVRKNDNNMSAIEWDLNNQQPALIDVMYALSVDALARNNANNAAHRSVIFSAEVFDQAVFSQEIITGQRQQGPLEIQIGDKVIVDIPENQTVQIEVLEANTSEVQLENGFYYARARVFDQSFEAHPLGEQIVLAPSLLADIAAPILPIADEIFIPVNTPYTISSSDIINNEANIELLWDFDNDGIFEQQGSQIELTPFTEIGSQLIQIAAIDQSNNTVEQEVTLVIFAPSVSIDAQTNEVVGIVSPSFLGVPVTLLRKRFGVWKEVSSSDSERFRTNAEGFFETGDLGEVLSGVIKNADGENIAELQFQGSVIKTLDNNHTIRLLSASDSFPMRFVVEDQNGNIVGNQIIVSDANTDLQVVNATIDVSSIFSVTAVDENNNDAITIHPISVDAPSYAGGALMVDSNQLQAIAAIEKQGSIRILSSNAQLQFIDVIDDVYHFGILYDDEIVDVYVPVRSDVLDFLHTENWGKDESLSHNASPSSVASSSIRDYSSESSTLFAQAIISDRIFTDISPNDELFEITKKLKDREIIGGFEDGSFRPQDNLTRAEFVKIVIGATACIDCVNPPQRDIEKYAGTETFPDIIENDWFFYCIARAKDREIVQGYADGNFYPNNNITRAEAIAVLLREAAIPIQVAAERYFDVPEGAWYEDYIYTAVENGLIQQINGFVRPDEQITRGEMAKLTSSIIELNDCRVRDSDSDGIPDEFEIDNGLDENFDDAQGDLDGDGISNLDEFTNGTDPQEQDLGGIGIGEPIQDDRDLCPEIPKEINNIIYINGCPDINGFFPDLGEGKYLIPGDTLVCGGVDFNSAIAPGDIFMGAITDQSGQIIFEQSNQVEIFLNQN